MKYVQGRRPRHGHINYAIENRYLFWVVPVGQEGQTFKLFLSQGMREQFLRYFQQSTLLIVLEVVYWPDVKGIHKEVHYLPEVQVSTD